MRRHIALMGFMGSGKSTVGAVLARQTGRAFVDLDQVVEAAGGRPIPRIFAEEGEAGFRRREKDALATVLAASMSQVIALGGGTVEDPENVAAIRRAAWLVWLKVDWEVVRERLSAGAGDRPLLAGGTAHWRALFERRQGVYRQAGADRVVDGNGQPELVAAAIVRALSEAACREAGA